MIRNNQHLHRKGKNSFLGPAIIKIFDDEYSLLKQLQKSLESQRYIVETAMDGEEASDKLFETPFDLIILDIMS